MTDTAERALMAIVADCATIIDRVRVLVDDRILSDQAADDISVHLLAVARACTGTTLH